MTIHDPADARWQRLADADLCGELLAPHEREFLAGHQASDPAVRVEQQLRRALADHGREDLVDADADDRLISAALAQLASPAPATEPDSLPPPALKDSPTAPVQKDSLTPAAAIPEPAPEPAPKDSPGRSAKITPPAADLLAEAREHRAAGRVREAVQAYQRLISGHPTSPLAGTAQLALGQLYLGPAADAKAALKAFDRYLELGGPLAEEAAHGRISALTRLGRKAEARAAIEGFLARYPASSYADALRRQSAP